MTQNQTFSLLNPPPQGPGASGHRSTRQALDLFDALPAVDTEFMLGDWRGAGFATGHPMDGLLESFNWHGKAFRDAEHVHPLVFAARGGHRYQVHPGRLPLQLALGSSLPRAAFMPALFRLMRPWLSTRRHRARLRMVQHRGQLTAAMVYDDLPIVDVFRRLNPNQLLGVMDMRGMSQPFFFRLTREQPRPDAEPAG